MSSTPVETKLAAARTRLILDKPFLGALVMRLPMVAVEWCRTTATDARQFYYNETFINALTLDEAQFVLAHEALHCALSHFARRQHRQKHLWDLACDFAINPLLIDDGLKAPPGSLMLEQFRGMTAEEIYPMLDDHKDKETLDTHAYDSDNQNSDGSEKSEKDLPPPDEPPHTQDGQQSDDRKGSGGKDHPPPPLTPDEQETLSIQWQQRMAGAAQQAMQAGKLGGEMARMIDHLLQPQLPWRRLLVHYLSHNARDDYSYMRPSRRDGDYILPACAATR